MLIQSTRFGELDIAEDQLLEFPHGMPGFSEEKKFAFMEYQPDSPFYFLQSVADADLTFLMIDPFRFFNDYEFAMDDELLAEIGLSDENPPLVFNIASVKDTLENMTVNLAAPVLVNFRDRKAVQLVIEKTEFPMRYPLFPAVEGGK
jgi:flagellar assembly factor FliW